MLLAEGIKRKKVISLEISLIDYKDAIDKIIAWARHRKSAYVCFANVHMTIEAYHDQNFASQVNGASLVLADGVPLVKFLRSLYNVAQERVAGMDIFPDLIRAAEINDLKIFFFGTTDELLEKIRATTETRFPNAKIAGLLSPPFDRSLDDERYIEIINASGANMVFVALGCPKQEKWMATHSDKINAILLGVGGAFPVYAGVVERAPKVMQTYGLEWLYRLYQEPGRLFKRYLKTNSLFIYLTARLKLKAILKKITGKAEAG